MLEADHLPKETAVMHCKRHQKGHDKITRGNKYADKAAKAVATSMDIFLGALISSLPTELPIPKYTQKEIEWASQHRDIKEPMGWFTSEESHVLSALHDLSPSGREYGPDTQKTFCQ